MSPELEPRKDQWVIQVFNSPEPDGLMYCMWAIGPFEDIKLALAYLEEREFTNAGLMKMTPPPEGLTPAYVDAGVPA